MGNGIKTEDNTFEKMTLYINTLEKNQRILLKKYFTLRKTVRWQNKMLNRMYLLMNKGQRNIADIWIGNELLKEVVNDDPSRTDY